MADEEVRERIIDLYSTLVSAVTPGLGELGGRTPREVEWLTATYRGARARTPHELTALFEEARNSTHRMPVEVLDRAGQALAHLAEDLERRY
jgi:hypothetical protein